MNKPAELLSFVVPVKDEQDTIRELYSQVATEVAALGRQFEMIFIDDGSTDRSWTEIQALASEDGRVRGIRFRRNIGKANALTAGFKSATGGIVFTMDADLQDDPKEIGRFLAKLDEGYDLVSGWKRKRHDPWHKVLPSRVFNEMISRLMKVRLHDHNCGFKCYRAEVVKSVVLYGEMHRMVPSLASIHGYRSAEIPVQHHPRLHGQSKYGVKRFLRGFMDLQTVCFLKNYGERPLHLMGGVAAISLVIGATIFGASAVGLLGAALAFSGAVIGASFMAAAPPLIACGFLAELLIHRGTTNDRELPIANVTNPPTSAKSGAPRAALESDEPPLVLIADDDPGILEVLDAQLTQAGFRVEQATNGDQVLEKMTAETAVVVLDLKMPGRDGIDCLRELRHRHAGVKVIMMSGLGETNDAVKAMKLGAFDYVQKPFDLAHLVGDVCRAAQLHALSESHLAVAA